MGAGWDWKLLCTKTVFSLDCRHRNQIRIGIKFSFLTLWEPQWGQVLASSGSGPRPVGCPAAPSCSTFLKSQHEIPTRYTHCESKHCQKSYGTQSHTHYEDHSCICHLPKVGAGTGRVVSLILCPQCQHPILTLARILADPFLIQLPACILEKQ